MYIPNRPGPRADVSLVFRKQSQQVKPTKYRHPDPGRNPPAPQLNRSLYCLPSRHFGCWGSRRPRRATCTFLIVGCKARGLFAAIVSHTEGGLPSGCKTWFTKAGRVQVRASTPDTTYRVYRVSLSRHAVRLGLVPTPADGSVSAPAPSQRGFDSPRPAPPMPGSLPRDGACGRGLEGCPLGVGPPRPRFTPRTLAAETNPTKSQPLRPKSRKAWLTAL